MLGCVDFNCLEVKVKSIAVAPSPGDIAVSPAAKNNDDSHTHTDNHAAMDLSAIEPEGKCPFKQCMRENFNISLDDPPALVQSTQEPNYPLNENETISNIQSQVEPVNENKTISITQDQLDLTDDNKIITIMPNQIDPIHGHNQLILQKLGILHLQDKLTRPRLSQETDEHILREAGIRCYNENFCSDDDNNSVYVQENDVKKMKPKLISVREAKILRDAGVKLMDIGNVIKTETVTTETPESAFADHFSAVSMSNMYAEKELMRRLKNGWDSTGTECEECQMLIISRRGVGMKECVICGIVDESPPHFQEEEMFSCQSTLMSGFSSNWQTGRECQTYYKSQVVMTEDPTVDSTICDSTVNNTLNTNNSVNEESDDEFRKELGMRLFSGWTLLSMNCPSCNLPLISEGVDGPSVCLRCG